jgi:hypothetical protein
VELEAPGFFAQFRCYESVSKVGEGARRLLSFE